MADNKGKRPFSNAPKKAAGLGAALAVANGDKPKATKGGTTAEAKKSSKPVITKVAKMAKAEPKAIDNGPFSLTPEAKKLGMDGMKFNEGSARHTIMTALFKANGKGVTREALEKLAPSQVTQSIRVLRRDGKVAA